MKTNFILLLTLCILMSCKTNSKINKENFDNEIVSIKFMASVNDYPRSILKRDFWNHKEEHAILKVYNNDFLNSVMRLENNDCSNFEEFKYAFIQKNKSTVDTIYSDYTLKTWIVKKEGKEEVCFYDEDGKIAEDLRNRYSFFKDCW